MIRRPNALLAILPAAFVALFFAWPVANLIARGLVGDVDRLGAVLTEGRFLRVIWFTVWQAAASTVLTAVASAPLTWAMANRRFPGRGLARVLVTIPFVLPTVVVAGAFVALLDTLGLDGLRHSIWAVLAAHVFFNIAVVVRTVGGHWGQLDRRQEEAARTLGASPWQVFLQVTAPRLRRSILSALSIVALFTFTSFAIILLLGGPRMATIETEIWRWAVSRSDIATAAALSVVQIGAVVALVWVNARLQRGPDVAEDHVGDRAARTGGARDRFVVGASLAWSALALGGPITILVVRSLRRGGVWSVANYADLTDRVRLLPVSALRAVGNSLLFAVVAAMIAVVVGGLGSLVLVHGRGWWRRVLELGLLLPLGTSAVTLGFGVLISLDRGVLDLRGSWWIVPITQALIGVPFIVRAVVPVLRSIDERQREAAATLGATPTQVWNEIDLRIGGRALATGLGFAFAVSLGEFGATSFVGRRPDLLTVPLAIGRLLGTPGEILRGQAMALAVILMLVTAVVVLIGDRLHPRGGAVL